MSHAIPTADRFDVAVVGGGPAGATAAHELVRRGHSVAFIDRPGRIKPCGGLIPPQLIREFEIPFDLIAANVRGARIVSPTLNHADMPIPAPGVAVPPDEEDGPLSMLSMVDREVFDEWLRQRAADAGAERRDGRFTKLERVDDGILLEYEEGRGRTDAPRRQIWARTVIGADGARSTVGKQAVPGAQDIPCVGAYHEIIESPPAQDDRFDPNRADLHYRGELSPDFYAWIFPHGGTTSVGVASGVKGFSLKGAVAQLRRETGLDQAKTLRCEGAPIPIGPLERWDDGQNVVLVGDAAGVVASASGEGIYYAMASAKYAADAVEETLRSGDGAALGKARAAFMRQHGQVFKVLATLQRFWYKNDNRRERFVSICCDPDVQALTWDAYMNKRLVKARPWAHIRIMVKNIAHLTGLARAR
ncbi:geranylgeranyl diphosphate reductase [Halorhodospira abdelmalekii]|uniref:geranylgeranyl diphosphate reductase n=1 Tax=Halorhodospira abdelmalekii TaxID=421629 RepID=UPI001A936A41|nr:geranylgeranyl diphosphate reductase [Halorhodospira abdelmalekii]MBK1735962.1 geranylgeranyl diphosphate reductase [Halorhodospira abdelmalekii]